MKGTPALLMEGFIRGTQGKGHETHVFHTTKEDVHPYIVYDTCCKTSNRCVFRDEMEKLSLMLADAELVVFVIPSYYFGMSAQIRIVFDCFYANNTVLWEQQKRTIILTIYGDTEDWIFDTLKYHFENVFRYVRWTCIGSVYILGMYIRENTEQSDYLKEAYELGHGL